MNWKAIVFLAAIAIVALIVFLPSGEKPIEQAAPTTGAMDDHSGHTHATDLPTIKSATVAVEGRPGELLGEVTLNAGEATPFPAGGVDLKLAEFYTHWNFDEGPRNISFEEVNPAAKIEILRNGELLGYSWAFKNAPFFRMSMHGAGTSPDSALAFHLKSYEGLTLPSDNGD